MSFGAHLSGWWRRLRGGARPTTITTPRPRVRPGWFDVMLDETRFLARFPGYAGVLARMDPVATDSVPAMAVGLRHRDAPHGRLVLMVNPAYFAAHPEHRVGVLLHEVQHVVLGHLASESLHRATHPRLVEIAMELSANEPITDPLPPGGVTLDLFERYGVREGQSTLERYVLLRDAWARGELKLQDHWLSRMWDLHRPGRRGERCAGVGDLVDERSDGATEESWGRDGWGLGGESSPREIARMRAAIQAHLRGPRGGDDDLRDPASLRNGAKALERVLVHTAEGARLVWPRVLRAAFPAVRRVTPDYLRPNRRFQARVGEVPGRRRRTPPPRILAAVDTSGSMSGDALDRCAREVARLARHARVLVAECDAAVHRVRPAGPQIQSLLGGGDTDFSPVFAEARARGGVDGVVYFTDGRGALPDVPPGLAVLWVITHDDPVDLPWGTVVRLPA
ncbi:MAG: VWA-like domain-containing protein [Polyangiales bacterium]